ncbi:MAG: sugar transferase [Bacteroidales bacterium]|nr:sugar transferase [Bacteroidales bacterium]
MCYRVYVKRILDIIVSLVGLLILAPLMIVVTVAVCISNGGSVFYTQPRVGLHGKIFQILKFKTMNDKRGDDGNLLPDANRLTPLGRLLRVTSIDELPQLVNVLKGDMSIVGPRPLLEKYVPYYTEEENRRHEVRGGITGLAQVSGRKNIDWDERLRYDVQYVDHCSFALDCHIVWQTFITVFSHEGVGVSSSGTNDFSTYRQRQWQEQINTTNQ